MVKDLGHITMEISVLPMDEVHSIQNVVVEEMENREHGLVNQVKY